MAFTAVTTATYLSGDLCASGKLRATPLQKILTWFNDRLGRTSAPSVVSVEERRAAQDAHRKKLGRIGEAAAEKQLRREGYRILERNCLRRGGEIDIIAEHAGSVVFVEVKTRSPRAWNTPESAVTPEKRTRIFRAATQYLSTYRTPSPVRYDIVSVMTDEADRVVSVTILPDAFSPGDTASPNPPEESTVS